MERRKKEISNLEHAIDNHNWELCLEICFKILYGLPFELQIDLCCNMIKRYLPIFDNRNPTIQWHHKILNDVCLYFNEHDRRIPFDKEGFCISDEFFVFSFDALLLAYCYRNKIGILSSSISCAINAAINARSYNVWIADDPEALIMWKKGNIPIERLMNNNSAFQAVCTREWNAIAQLFLEKRVFNNTNDVDIKKMEQFVEYWKDGEMSLIVPEIRSLLEDESKRLRLKDVM